MRTTLDIDADVLEIAKGMAQDRKVSVGKMISALARRGAKTPIQPVEKDGVYMIPKEVTGKITSEDVRAALDSEYDDILRNFGKRRSK